MLLQRLTGYGVPSYVVANQDQRWLSGLFTLVFLVSKSVNEDSDISSEPDLTKEVRTGISNLL